MDLKPRSRARHEVERCSGVVGKDYRDDAKSEEVGKRSRKAQTTRAWRRLPFKLRHLSDASGHIEALSQSSQHSQSAWKRISQGLLAISQVQTRQGTSQSETSPRHSRLLFRTLKLLGFEAHWTEMNPHISLPRQHGPSSGAGGPSAPRNSGVRMPAFFRRMFKFPSMDFELAVWEMTSLIIAPKKVFRSIYYHVRSLHRQSNLIPTLYGQPVHGMY